ncbi:hypothetical protein JCM33374_g4663 [Metschnikowia sp. JCM 33374]|nr:hypothetical protein JCM33374_g4663 [Metschnikowia sp. JCM 33374]
MGYPQEIGSFVAKCNDEYNASMTRASFDVALSKYYDLARDVPSDTRLTAGTVVDFPVKLSWDKIALYKASYDQFLGNYNRSIDYGWYMVLYWLGVFGLAALGNWSKILQPNLVKKCTGVVSRCTRSAITLPALTGKERTSEKRLWKFFDYLPPTRAESLIVAVFCLSVVHFGFYKIHFVPEDPIFGFKRAAYMRYFAVRSGIIASSLLPFSVLFAGRNNVLQWITRWEYSTFVMFHRWISRVMVLLLLVHSIGYIHHIRFPLVNTRTYVFFGVLGTLSGLLILIQGLLVLRRKWYEVFLAIHIVLAGAFVVGAWVHVQNLNFLWYFYVSACLWVFDRVIRVQRIYAFGFPTAKIQLYEDDTLKFQVPKPAGFQAEGGGHCFVHYLYWTCFWQSHPFTYTVLDGNIVFYVKVKEGVTARLKKYLEEHPSRAAYMRVAVEGSYGEATPAMKYDTSVFIAGGNGIPGIYAEAVEVLRRKSGSRRVKLIWVVREYVSLAWFYEELRALEFSEIETEVYVTRPSCRLIASDVNDKSVLLENTYTHKTYYGTKPTEDPIEKLKRDLKHVWFREGRPNVEKIVELNVEESPGSTCFVTCGHPVMVDDIRYEVVQKVSTSAKRVDYFEQLQVWA